MRYLILAGALLLACLPAVAQSKYDAPLPRPVVVVRQAPPVIVRPAPVVQYVVPRPVETPIFSVGGRCLLRIVGIPVICAP